MKSISIRETLQKLTASFASCGIDTARLDAEVLLAHALKISRIGLITQSQRLLTPYEQILINTLADRRIQREPLAYLLETREFYSLDFHVTPDVLIPRPETEMLVEQGLHFLQTESRPLKVLDIGTGSGCIALSITHHLPEAEVWGVDVSLPALKIAQVNTRNLNLESSVHFSIFDLMRWEKDRKIPDDFPSQFDLILSNPPYIATDQVQHLAPELQHEPLSALAGGKTGVEFYPVLLNFADAYLKKTGLALFEIGSDQGKELLELSQKKGFLHTEILKDGAGLDRVLKISKLKN